MQEDRRAHERLDTVESLMKSHSADIQEMKISLNANTVATEANTMATKVIETNTSEIVSIMRGAKTATTAVVFMSKLFGALAIIVGTITAVWYAFVHYIQEGIK